ITKEAEPVANFPHLKGKGPWLGVTCAACHVGAVAVNGTRYILDGAPAKTDFQTFSIKIENGLANLLKDDLSFAQFKKAVGKEVRKADIQDVYNRLSARNTRSFYHKTERESGPINAGPGRSDAFAIILNEVDSRALGVKENSKEGTAPVSFPQLWTAPYLKWIQYSGLSNNAFTRNIGEVLGVFGDVNLDPQSPDFLATTARVDKVQVLEQHLRSLKAPKWESVFGKFTATEREQIARGAATYRGHCAQCHLPEQSHKLGEFQSVSLIPAVEFGADYTRNKVFAGTDPLYFINLKRNWVSIDPGPLKGTSVIAEMIKHNPTLLGKLRFPDDQMVGGILKRGKDGQKYLDGLAKEKPFGASTNGVIVLAQTTLGIALKYMGDNNIKMDQQDPAYQSLTGGALPEIQPVVGAFKARSLEGIWATAPYLHSGSVRSLRDLLSPPSERESEFYVGGDEYDVKNVGFRSSGKFLFRSNKLGNGSSGHYSFLKVSELDESAKEDLLMYLKSI
ncbi:MAG: di-heme-cytochrome C peroxidase, partial [Proteobacteria bacterium]|nr:di-heme-cytochrome C peroxidase [Pseudomonadota bacterium]